MHTTLEFISIFLLFWSLKYSECKECDIEAMEPFDMQDFLDDEYINLNKILQKPKIKDLWGHVVDWKNSDEGWNESARKNFLQYHKVVIERTKKVPAFTKYGYKIMKIPEELLEYIENSKKLTALQTEVREGDPWPVHNYRSIHENGTTGKSN